MRKVRISPEIELNDTTGMELVKLLKKDILCPELATSVTSEDADKVYLVPID
jgi:hypothetical protein